VYHSRTSRRGLRRLFPSRERSAIEPIAELWLLHDPHDRKRRASSQPKILRFAIIPAGVWRVPC
jgi:hypothetical protein